MRARRTGSWARKTWGRLSFPMRVRRSRMGTSDFGSINLATRLLRTGRHSWSLRVDICIHRLRRREPNSLSGCAGINCSNGLGAAESPTDSESRREGGAHRVAPPVWRRSRLRQSTFLQDFHDILMGEVKHDT